MKFVHPENINLSDQLSVERTKLSNQRTLLSFLRSGLYLILSGLAVENFDMFTNYKYISIAFLLCGFGIVFAGVYNFFKIRSAIIETHIFLDED